MPAVLVTAPAAEPLTVPAVKEHLRVTIDDDNGLIGGLIAAARAYAEDLTHRALITQTWDLVLDCFPAWVIQLPRPPLAAIVSVKYTDTAGAQQTLAASKYLADVKSTPGRVTPAFGLTWPSTRAEMNAVEIRFTAGYGAASTAVPEALRQGMLLLIATWYEHRESIVVGAPVAEMPAVANADRILLSHRYWSF